MAINPHDLESPNDDLPEQSYHPNMKQLDEENQKGLFCFLNNTRPCGPDCMAFLPKPPQGPHYQGEQWAQCLLLVNADRTGRHLAILVEQQKKAYAEAQRARTAPKGG